MPAGDVNPASLARVTPELPVPSTALRPQTPQVPPSPQTAVPVATLGTTREECVPPRSPRPAVPVLSATFSPYPTLPFRFCPLPFFPETGLFLD